MGSPGFPKRRGNNGDGSVRIKLVGEGEKTQPNREFNSSPGLIFLGATAMSVMKLVGSFLLAD